MAKDLVRLEGVKSDAANDDRCCLQRLRKINATGKMLPENKRTNTRCLQETLQRERRVKEFADCVCRRVNQALAGGAKAGEQLPTVSWPNVTAIADASCLHWRDGPLHPIPTAYRARMEVGLHVIVAGRGYRLGSEPQGDVCDRHAVCRRRRGCHVLYARRGTLTLRPRETQRIASQIEDARTQ